MSRFCIAGFGFTRGIKVRTCDPPAFLPNVFEFQGSYKKTHGT